MSELKFVFQGESLPVGRTVARQVCGVLAHDVQIGQLSVRSRVGGDVVRLFVSAVEGELIELANENVDGLSALCDEFKFTSLSRRVEEFKNTSISRLEKRCAKMEEGSEGVFGRVTLLEAEVTALRSTGKQSRRRRLHDWRQK
jgi:hypothetical protein